MDLETLLISLGALGLLGLIAVSAPALATGATRKRLRRRLASVSGSGVPVGQSAGIATTVRRDVRDSSIVLLDRLIKQLMPRPAVVRAWLAATGKRIAVSEYILSSLLTAIVSYLLLAYVARLPIAASVLFGIGGGAMLPRIVINQMISRRRNKFLSLFPEAIELMVRGLKSGVPVSESIKVAGREVPDPVGVEFRAITDGMALGQTMDEALAGVSERVALPEFRFFVISLGIQQETGGNLSETLENLVSVLRKRRQMKLKIKALSSEARASAYILGSLPNLMFGGLLMLSPDYAGVLIHDSRGHIVLATAAGFLALGVGVMIKMGKFQI